VISANTDGILIKCPANRYNDLNTIIAHWEQRTGLETEEAKFSAVYSKSVGDYLAIKTNGKVKGKSSFSCPWGSVTEGPSVFKFHKNPTTTIVIEAIIELLRDGIPLEKTIRDCTDIRKFVAIRKVEGGAMVNERYLGKVIRWYYNTGERSSTNYMKAGSKGKHNKVPKSDGSKPLMVLPDELPGDINYDWYIAEAKEALRNIGYGQRTLW
jgi:hypothetical protein